MSTSSLGLAFGNNPQMTMSSQRGGLMTHSNIPMTSSQHLIGSQNLSSLNLVTNNKFYMIPAEQTKFANDEIYFSPEHHHNRSQGEYIGERKNNLRHGHGQLWYSNGDYYIGSWEENEPSGEGLLLFNSNFAQNSKFSHPPKLAYSGHFQKGYFHGFGKLFVVFSATDGHYIYIGNWKTGKREGYGKEYYNDNEKQFYLGYWGNDMRHGEGKLFFSHGFYEGKWAYNMMHGEGALTLKDGYQKTVTVGIWNEDQLKSGQISYYQTLEAFQSKEEVQQGLYKGEIKNYLKEGQGHYQIQGTGYSSKFLRDEPIGEGILKGSIDKNNIELKANFIENTMPSGQASIRYWNSDNYEGKVDIDNWVIKRTQGKYFYSNGNAIEGTFIDNPQGELKGKYWSII